MENPSPMRIKLDKNISRHLKAFLSEAGHDATTAAEQNLLGKSDVEVGAAARREGRLIFTLDIEFADLRKFAPGTHPGVVLFRPRSMGPLAVNRLILSFAQETDLAALAGCVVVVEPDRIRVRRPPPERGGIAIK